MCKSSKITVSQVAVLLIALVLAGCSGSHGNQAITDESLPLQLPALGAWPEFSYPSPGQLGVDPSSSVSWSAVENAYAYQLQIGTSPGANDVFDSGIVSTTSVQVPNLPHSGALYARVRAILNGWSTALGAHFPRATYIAFSVDANPTGATFNHLTQGSSVDADTPISWQPDPVAQSYRLTIGTSSGASDLVDTGQIRSTLRVVPGLPQGTTVFATLYTTYVGNLVRTQQISFVVGNSSTSNAGMMSVARILTAAVRGMADIDNQPYGDSPLVAFVAAEQSGAADCVAFSNALMAQLQDANVPLRAQSLAVCLNTNAYDCHALVEVYDPDSQRWTTLDPTFGLYAVNAAGQPAEAAEISAAVRAQSFSQLGFQYLTPAGNAYAQAYYIDYPLLFLNIYKTGTTQTVQPPPPLLEPYFDLLGSSVSGASLGYYAIQCTQGYTAATANWDGTSQTYPCTNGFTPIFQALSVTLDDPSGASIWQVHRFVF